MSSNRKKFPPKKLGMLHASLLILGCSNTFFAQGAERSLSVVSPIHSPGNKPLPELTGLESNPTCTQTPEFPFTELCYLAEKEDELTELLTSLKDEEASQDNLKDDFANETDREVIKSLQYLVTKCSSPLPFRVLNTDENVRLGINGGEIMPFSCREQGSQSEICKNEKSALKNLPHDTSALFSLRDLTLQEVHQFAQSIQTQVDRIKQKLKPEQAEDFQKAINGFYDLYWQHKVLEQTPQTGGMCIETCMQTIFDILRDGKFDYRLQTLRVRSVERVSQKQLIHDHTTVFYSPRGVDDFEIKTTARYARGKIIQRNLAAEKKQIKKIGKLLSELDGYICDRWNNHLFVHISKDLTGLYSQQAEWEEVRLRTIFDFELLTKLTREGYTFIKQQYQLMGIDLPKYFANNHAWMYAQKPRKKSAQEVRNDKGTFPTNQKLK